MGFEKLGENTPLSWQDFEDIALSEIYATKKARELDPISHSEWIYRGQSNADWSLLTSLERYHLELDKNPKEATASDYFHTLDGIIPTINSMLEKNFKRLSPQQLRLEASSSIDHYELMCFTRQLGFPSPLLDWSLSFYVAAFFAFRHAKKDENVAIYALKEWNGNARFGKKGEPTIYEGGSYIESHSRHFKQQSSYTFCTGFQQIYGDNHLFFMNHELAVTINPDKQELVKYIILGSERDNVLERLYMMNINDFTLFGDEESLFRMLAYKHLNSIT